MISQGRRASILGLLLLSVMGCVTVIRPPVAPEDPVPVLVVDYGHHSSLLLPRTDGGCAEYAFGDWGWFALNRDEWYRACPTLCSPNQGALGRRRLGIPPTRSATEGLIVCRESHELQVARADADRLLRSLDAAFEKSSESRVDNPLMKLEFVRHDVDYCFLVNCNHLVARWLRELGCTIGGSACFSRFRVEPPE